MATITSADVQEWLEHEADRWLGNPQVAPTLIMGISEVGQRWPVIERSLRDGIYDRLEPPPFVEFYAIWGGMEFTTKRPRRAVVKRR